MIGPLPVAAPAPNTTAPPPVKLGGGAAYVLGIGYPAACWLGPPLPASAMTAAAMLSVAWHSATAASRVAFSGVAPSAPSVASVRSACS